MQGRVKLEKGRRLKGCSPKKARETAPAVRASSAGQLVRKGAPESKSPGSNSSAEFYSLGRSSLFFHGDIALMRHHHSISGLVVEYIVAIDVTRVRFPADAKMSEAGKGGKAQGMQSQKRPERLPQLCALRLQASW